VFREVEARDRAGDLQTSEAFEYSRWQAIVSRVLDDVTDQPSCFAELYDHFARATAWRVFADVAPAFEELCSRGVTLVLASNFDQRLLDIAGQVWPLALCRHVLVSSQVGWRKPHPQFFQAILATVGTDPQRVLYVGDDLENDVAGPRSVGMPAVQLIRRGPLRNGAIRSLKELVYPRSDCADY
jgi:putative hydrolase of the HAD superfamily